MFHLTEHFCLKKKTKKKKSLKDGSKPRVKTTIQHLTAPIGRFTSMTHFTKLSSDDDKHCRVCDDERGVNARSCCERNRQCQAIFIFNHLQHTFLSCLNFIFFLLYLRMIFANCYASTCFVMANEKW